jgi:hypothetical protein
MVLQGGMKTVIECLRRRDQNIYQFCVYNNMSDVISVRVKKGLKEKAEELGINIRDVVEKALEKAIEEKEKEELKKLASDIKQLMKDVSEEEWVEAIRRSRDER